MLRPGELDCHIASPATLPWLVAHLVINIEMRDMKMKMTMMMKMMMKILMKMKMTGLTPPRPWLWKGPLSTRLLLSPMLHLVMNHES